MSVHEHCAESEKSFLSGPYHLSKLLSSFYLTNVNWQLDQKKKHREPLQRIGLQIAGCIWANSFLLSIWQMWTDSWIRSKTQRTPAEDRTSVFRLPVGRSNHELRSHDWNWVRIFVFHETARSFFLWGDPHVRAFKQVKTNENSLDFF